MSNDRKIEVYKLHGDEALVPRRKSLQMSVEAEHHKHLRKAITADQPLRRTLKWMENLPPDVQPTALLRLHARIANLIVATWRDPKAFGAYMDSLLHDKRGNRRGFSSEVEAELVTLKRYYDTHIPSLR